MKKTPKYAQIEAELIGGWFVLSWVWPVASQPKIVAAFGGVLWPISW